MAQIVLRRPFNKGGLGWLLFFCQLFSYRNILLIVGLYQRVWVISLHNSLKSIFLLNTKNSRIRYFLSEVMEYVLIKIVRTDFEEIIFSLFLLTFSFPPNLIKYRYDLWSPWLIIHLYLYLYRFGFVVTWQSTRFVWTFRAYIRVQKNYHNLQSQLRGKSNIVLPLRQLLFNFKLIKRIVQCFNRFRTKIKDFKHLTFICLNFIRHIYWKRTLSFKYQNSVSVLTFYGLHVEKYLMNY